MKINVDAGCWAEGITGHGMVVRDQMGIVKFAAINREYSNMSPTMAEALGLRWCFLWAAEQDYPDLVFESDAELVVNCFYGLNKLLEIDAIIKDCRDIAIGLKNVKVLAIPRGKNNAAHGLVKLAKELGPYVWLDSVPSVIETIVCKESVSVV